MAVPTRQQGSAGADAGDPLASPRWADLAGLPPLLIQVGDEEIPVRGQHVRSARLRRLVTQAYAEKYPTKGSVKWVKGFAEPEREINTLELLRGRRRSS